ncbi:MAG TPA: SRPBCC family protein [Gemmatimonadaceae bacterium]|nr:SRPBCC family protein [Gemmatimonadaceae bacterium]
MRAFHFVEHIDRPPRDVWNALTDLTVASRWRPLVVTMETVDGQPLHDGSDVRVIVDIYGKRLTRVSHTTAFDPPRRWTLHSSDTPSYDGFFDFVLSPDGSGTRIEATCDLEAHGFLPWLFMPLIANGERRRRVEMLPNLKRFVEGRALP